MRLLDLFCGAGGAAMGYQRAGFEIVGVDNRRQPHYPFEFIQSGALRFLREEDLSGYDVIHASPPCQAYSSLRYMHESVGYPNLVPTVRDILRRRRQPYVIENVERAPIDGILLCGTMFPELRVIRHRLFESNVPLFAPEHEKHPLIYTTDSRRERSRRSDPSGEWLGYVLVTGHTTTVEAARDAMDIDWMNRDELAQAIPPAYTEFIGQQLQHVLRSQIVAA
jgi:DNA (cytosine-5)-methyltransferase 1